MTTAVEGLVKLFEGLSDAIVQQAIAEYYAGRKEYALILNTEGINTVYEALEGELQPQYASARRDIKLGIEFLTR